MMPLAPVWSILFFLMMFFVGLDTLVSRFVKTLCSVSNLLTDEKFNIYVFHNCMVEVFASENVHVTRPPLELRLNWVPDAAPTPPRDHGKENHPPAAEPRKLPRKIRPRRKRKEHHHHPGASGSAPGTSQLPRYSMSTPVKHLQPPQLHQHPQPPRSAATQYLAQPNLLDQAELGWLYKPAHSSLSKESTTRSRRDYFSGSNFSLSSKRSHPDYFSGLPSGHTNKNQFVEGCVRMGSEW